jgi:hypothetical protein
MIKLFLGIVLFIPTLVFLLFAIYGLLWAVAILITIVCFLSGLFWGGIVLLCELISNKADNKSKSKQLEDLCRKLQEDP